MICEACNGVGRNRGGYLCEICDGAGEIDWRSSDFAEPDTEIAALVDAKLRHVTRSPRRAAVAARDRFHSSTANRRQA